MSANVEDTQGKQVRQIPKSSPIKTKGHIISNIISSLIIL